MRGTIASLLVIGALTLGCQTALGALACDTFLKAEWCEALDETTENEEE